MNAAIEFVLDAHPLVWYLEGNPRLGRRAKSIMDARDSAFILPIIALAEAAFVVERGRTRIPSVQTLVGRVEADQRIRIVPLTMDVLRESFGLLAIPEMHDPLIVATARLLQARGRSVTLISRDETIVASRLIATVW